MLEIADLAKADCFKQNMSLHICLLLLLLSKVSWGETMFLVCVRFPNRHEA